MNLKIRETFKALAECYYLANDKPRRNTFLQAELLLTSLEEELSLDSNLDSLPKGFGTSTKAIIKEVLETGECSRLKDLQLKYPPQLQSNLSLFSLGEESSFYLLGDIGVRTNFSSGNKSIAVTALDLKKRGHKHIFIADVYQTNSELYGLKEKELSSYLKNIKQAQIDLDIRIFAGVQINLTDWSEEIEATLKKLNSSVEFIIINTSLSEENLKSLVSFIQSANITYKIIIDSTSLSKDAIDFFDENLFSIMIKTSSITASSSLDKFSPSLKKVAFSTDNTFNDSLIKQSIQHLQLSKSQVLNCTASPFKNINIVSNNIAGVKQ